MDDPMMPAGNPEAPEPTKKEQILSLYAAGVHDVEGLAQLTDARPGYVAEVLREEGIDVNYYDLYTSTQHPMNAYSRYFAGRLGFKDEATARRSVAYIDRLHQQFARTGDRAGQHHAQVMALTMFNRARWTGKHREAEVFRQWLLHHLPPQGEE